MTRDKRQVLGWGVLVATFFVLAWCAMDSTAAPTTADRSGSVDKTRQDYHIAGAYACGMLDALQEKRHRPKACDDYRTIAKEKGVSVPP